MYTRLLEKPILDALTKYSCITLVGPRQSGKTTLCKKLFPTYAYFSFESPNTVLRYIEDPIGFLRSIKANAVFDEVQKVPDLLSYLQEILDDREDKRKFILTGSNNLKLSSKVSQSLSGRTRIFHVLPLQRKEISSLDQKYEIDSALFYGSYPRIYDEKLDPTEWLGDYLHTYVEKDIRDTINITNLKSFNNFLRLLAGRVGQLVNFNSLGADAGVTQPTSKAWISSLETTFICFSLAPYFKNFNKRLVKSSKIYFYDTGLLCYLLRIHNEEQLNTHPLKGLIFENWIIAEKMKSYTNLGQEPPLYFWRDTNGHEIDLVVDRGEELDLIEIKSGQTFQSDYLKNIKWLNSLRGTQGGECIYGGDESAEVSGIKLTPWNLMT